MGKEFYRDSIQEDFKRIHPLFAKASENGVRVVPVTLVMDDIKRFLLSNRYAIILLVNSNLLSCLTCRKTKKNTLSLFDCCIPTKGYKKVQESQEFVGHYIVLIGYDFERDVFLYRDPGVESPLCEMKEEDVQAAYYSQETDRDLIVVRIL
jgi:hypothetical protein